MEYYIRLEQARGPRPSRSVLNALAQAFRLDRDQYVYLCNVVGEVADSVSDNETVPSTIRNFLAGLTEFPAYVVNASYDIVTWNELADAFMGLSHFGPADRNIIRATFVGALRDVSDPQHLAFVRSCVADMRAHLAQNPSDSRLTSLVDELLGVSAEFEDVWNQHEVAVRRTQTKSVVHPVVGPIEIESQVLDIPGTAFRLVVYVPHPGSASERALKRLREVA